MTTYNRHQLPPGILSQLPGATVELRPLVLTSQIAKLLESGDEYLQRYCQLNGPKLLKSVHEYL